jgi:uncharacterized protein (DUF885 family)
MPMNTSPNAGGPSHLFEEMWDSEMRRDPLWATACGDNRFNDRLPRVTEEACADAAASRRGFLERVRAYPREAVSVAERVSLAIAERFLADAIAEHGFHGHWMPVSKASGFQAFFPDLPRGVPLRTVADYENYVARLNAFGQFVEDHIDLMRYGLREGIMPPMETMESVEASIEPHIVRRAEESRLYQPFKEFPAAIAGGDRARLTAAGEKAILSSVAAGYAALLEFLTREYMPHLRPEIGLASLPRGSEFYEFRIRHHTTLGLTPREVHETGLSEVARIRAEMEALVRSAGIAGSVADFAVSLRKDPRQYAATPEHLMKEAAYLAKRMDGKLPALFCRLPRTPYGIERIPDAIAPKSTSAYYFVAAGDGSRAGQFYINTHDLGSRPLYELEALTYHEAVPGHHLQFALQFEVSGIPAFRKFITFTAYCEGWALYAERLGLDVGGYESVSSNFGRLTFEMWRACRLVVDTGLHYFGWPRQKAIEFMAENMAASSRLDIENEVDRYIAWPGQAVSYKIGELKMRELRALAERELGAAFDLRSFHDRILADGSVPLDVLDGGVRDWMHVAKEGCSGART